MNKSSLAVGGPLEPSVRLRLLACAAALALAGCGPEPDMAMQKRQRMQTPAPPVSEGSRVTVERIGVFKDDLAYGDRRGVYVIRDKATGREFIGVSGIGITEVGSHAQPAGKVMIHRQDER